MALVGLLSQWKRCYQYNNILSFLKEKRNNNLQIFGLKNSSRSFLLSALIEEVENSCLIITDTSEDALMLYQDLSTLLIRFPQKNIFLFPSLDILPYEDISPDPQIMEQRISILNQLSSKKEEWSKERVIVISEVKAFLSKLINPEDFRQASRELQVGDNLKKEALIEFLLSQNYQPAEMVERKGQFSSRGGIIDFFPVSSKNPLRLELFADQIESIRYFNLDTQNSIARVNSFTLLPSCEITSFYIDGTTSASMSTLIDYLPDKLMIMLNEPEILEEKAKIFWEEITQSYQKIQGEKEEKDISTFAPSVYFFSWLDLYSQIKEKKNICFSSILAEINESNKEEEQKFSFQEEKISSYFGNLDLLVKDLKKYREEKQHILLLLRSEGRANRLVEILEERGIERFRQGRLTEYSYSDDLIYISFGYLNYGFRLPEINFLMITEQEIFGKVRKHRYRPFRYKSETLSSLLDIRPGDYVVHIDHGIGIYRGIVNLLARGLRQDYLFIEYAEGDKLYVPVDQFNLVHKYIGVKEQQPKINRLGGVSWERTKKRVKDSVKKLAQELYQLYLTRQSIKGFAFSADNYWQQELEMSFPFEETYDQIQALQEVKKDMETSRPMERLICGDVGYGKTEIAIRAAFKAVMDGKQVAMLAPTTILVQQHYETFRERMRSFPINIDMLSRFRSRGEQQEIIERLKEGKIDIIIGTHRLIQDDVKFKDLGLLVVDEEQRFGVLHKEKIKKIKESVDSLTLSATPIPRTLHMSLIGVRDLSVINTPPEDRFPIATYICQREERIIREAIKRELQRGGQVFFVHNRIRDLQKIARELSQIIPQVRIALAHGRMEEEELERIMLDFLEKKYDILLCTTIIEIGLDIPNVNTIIIDDAHQFGLSQLYQLRGRVGRADRRAYAYLFYPTYRAMSGDAHKRLEAIQEFSDLGSGFKLAMRDLEIRGAGNLLGKEQHGFVSEVGFNLYCHLLEEEINGLKEGGEHKEETKEFNPVIDLPMEAYIPEQYISSIGQRLLWYKKLAEIQNLEQLEKFKEEIRDRYGVYPPEVRNLLEMVYLKIFLKNLRIISLKVRGKTVLIKYLPECLDLARKFNQLSVFYQERLIKEEKKLAGTLKLDLTGIAPVEVLKFLKELVLNLSR
ncbi:MAG: transcription-repair coupling factor [Candidatus Caldatribacteriota bacterium]